MNLSLCCISNILAEQGYKFRTMTYKSFSSKPKEESLNKLSEIVLNNFIVTNKIIRPENMFPSYWKLENC